MNRSTPDGREFLGVAHDSIFGSPEQPATGKKKKWACLATPIARSRPDGDSGGQETAAAGSEALGEGHGEVKTAATTTVAGRIERGREKER
jgi:hypothetical protein